MRFMRSRKASTGFARRSSIAVLMYAVALQAFLAGWTGAAAASAGAHVDGASIACLSPASNGDAGGATLPFETAALCQCMMACMAGHHSGGGLETGESRVSALAIRFQVVNYDLGRETFSAPALAGAASARGPPSGV
jgi:hypothetical protein